MKRWRRGTGGLSLLTFQWNTLKREVFDVGNAVTQIGEFVGRCDSCGDTIYDYQNRYLVKIGKQDFTLCPCCCIRIDRKRPPKTNGLAVREYTDEEFADFLTWVQQDAYAYGAFDSYGGMAYPNTYLGWLKWFGEEEAEKALEGMNNG
jgi:hypothetical protein